MASQVPPWGVIVTGIKHHEESEYEIWSDVCHVWESVSCILNLHVVVSLESQKRCSALLDRYWFMIHVLSLARYIFYHCVAVRRRYCIVLWRTDVELAVVDFCLLWWYRGSSVVRSSTVHTYKIAEQDSKYTSSVHSICNMNSMISQVEVSTV